MQLPKSGWNLTQKDHFFFVIIAKFSVPSGGKINFGISPGCAYFYNTGANLVRERRRSSSSSSHSFQSWNIPRCYSFNFDATFDWTNMIYMEGHLAISRTLSRCWWAFCPRWGACGLVSWPERRGPLPRIWRGREQGLFSSLHKELQSLQYIVTSNFYCISLGCGILSQIWVRS